MINTSMSEADYKPKPEWLKVRVPGNEGYFRIKALVDKQRLNTVCQNARCPNIGECWGKGTATFMILGNIGGLDFGTRYARYLL